MPAITTKRTQPRRFVPDNLDASDPQAVTRLYDTVAQRDISSRQALEDCILDWQEVEAVLMEGYAESYVDMTSDTANAGYKDKYLQMVEQIMPIFEHRGFALKQKLLTSPALDQLGDDYAMFLRNTRAEVEIFREENVPLTVEDRKLSQQYEEISGAQEAEFRGEVYPLPQLVPFLEETDRDTREEAWLARAEAKLNDAATFDDLYDRMLTLRQQIATNAGFDNFRDYQFKAYKRFDYTPEDCVAFHEAIEKHIVPVVSGDQERRKSLLGVDTLRPWDLAVDPEGHEPLHPFDNVD